MSVAVHVNDAYYFNHHLSEPIFVNSTQKVDGTTPRSSRAQWVTPVTPWASAAPRTARQASEAWPARKKGGLQRTHGQCRKCEARRFAR